MVRARGPVALMSVVRASGRGWSNTGMIQGFTGDGSDSEIKSYEGNKQIMTKVLTPGQSVKNVL